MSDFYFMNIIIKHKKTRTKSNSSSKIQSGADDVEVYNFLDKYFIYKSIYILF